MVFYLFLNSAMQLTRYVLNTPRLIAIALLTHKTCVV